MKMIINGKDCDPITGKYTDIHAPATGEIIDRVPVGDERDIDAAVTGACEAFCEWSRRPVYERAEILYRFVSLVKRDRDELARQLCRDNGKPITQAYAEIDNIFISVPGFIEKAKHLYDTIIPPGTEKNYERHLQIVKREPLGVVACIIPFNFPSNLFCQKTIPALLMGNCVLVLPPSSNPLTVLSLTRLLVEAGIPDGVISCVCAPGAVKEAAVKDPRVSLISLTGSSATGVRTAQCAAPSLKRLALELGGNDPFIVMEDADIDLAVSELFVGRLVNAGQICCASKRFIVHESVADEFTKKAVEFVSSLKMGDPMDETTRIGCLIDEAAAKQVEKQVEDTIAAGASLAIGGRREGAFYEPVILKDVTADMDIARDMEVFGPVIPIIRFSTQEEALRIANNSVYGLSGCIFSEDHRRIMSMISKLMTGNVIINGASNLRSFEMPFGGIKMSGLGTEGVMSTFDEVTRKKVVILKGYEF